LWLRLGISLERIKPGHSQRNSRPERRQPQPDGANILPEQAKFDDFVEEFNHQTINPSTSLAGQAVGEWGIWLVSSLGVRSRP
jgi:putative transposase